MSDVVRISPQQALEKLQEGFTYVDVRSEPEFGDGHPAGAFNVPIMHLTAGAMSANADFLRVMRSHFPREAKLVVGCKAGGRSLRAAQELLQAGYTHVLVQRAGWDGARNPFGQVTEPGWVRAGLPVESGQPTGRCYADLHGKVD